MRSLLLLVFLLTHLGDIICSPDKVFPSLDDILEFAALAHAIQIAHGNLVIPDDVEVELLHYEEHPDGTDFIIVSSKELHYVAVIFAGTNEAEDVPTDLTLPFEKFGPTHNPIFSAVRVHMGFNQALFSNGVFDDVLNTVESILNKNPDYRVITAGYSLGAATSVLAGVGLAYHLPTKNIENYNFGCPETGDSKWREYVNNMPNMEVWRFVNRDDCIARLPGLAYTHVGHTVQMDDSGVKTYYYHHGDKELGYAGVPWNWELTPIANPTDSVIDHFLVNYIDFFENKSRINPKKYFDLSFQM